MQRKTKTTEGFVLTVDISDDGKIYIGFDTQISVDEDNEPLTEEAMVAKELLTYMTCTLQMCLNDDPNVSETQSFDKHMQDAQIIVSETLEKMKQREREQQKSTTLH